MSNFFTSLEDLRTLGTSTTIKKVSKGVMGIEDLGKNYSRGISDVEECVEMAVEDISVSNQFGMLVASNLQYVDAISRVVEGRNNYVRQQKTMGNESFSDVKMINALALSTEGKVSDWFKKVWEGIKEAFRRLIVAIGNIVRSVIAWFKKATVKRQAKVYEYYRNAPQAKDWEKAKITCNVYNKGMKKVTEVMKITSAQSGHGDEIHNAVEKFMKTKDVTIQDKQVFVKKVEKIAFSLFDNFKIKGKNGKETFSKWSGTAFFNSYVFGDASPEKKEQTFGDVMKGITGSQKGFADVLSAKASAEILKIVGIGRKVINDLAKDLKFVEKTAKTLSDKDWERKYSLRHPGDSLKNLGSAAYDKARGADGQKTQGKSQEVVKAINKLRWYKSILTNNLLGSFMAYVRMRTIVFNIFMKSIKGDLKDFKTGKDASYYSKIDTGTTKSFNDSDKLIRDFRSKKK